MAVSTDALNLADLPPSLHAARRRDVAVLKLARAEKRDALDAPTVCGTAIADLSHRPLRGVCVMQAIYGAPRTGSNSAVINGSS